jgi:hypothetical protein
MAFMAWTWGTLDCRWSDCRWEIHIFRAKVEPTWDLGGMSHPFVPYDSGELESVTEEPSSQGHTAGDTDARVSWVHKSWRRRVIRGSRLPR